MTLALFDFGGTMALTAHHHLRSGDTQEVAEQLALAHRRCFVGEIGAD